MPIIPQNQPARLNSRAQQWDMRRPSIPTPGGRSFAQKEFPDEQKAGWPEDETQPACPHPASVLTCLLPSRRYRCREPAELRRRSRDNGGYPAGNEGNGVPSVLVEIRLMELVRRPCRGF